MVDNSIRSQCIIKSGDAMSRDHAASVTGDVHEHAAPGREHAPTVRPMKRWASATGGMIQPRPGELVGVEGAFIEGLLGMASGLVFGFVGTSLGHPADTIKTKMQADPQFSGRGAIFVFRSTVKRDGVLSLYRGFLPPLIGGSCFCSAVFGSYSSTFAACEGTFLMDPMVSGFRPAIVFASIAAASARTVIETPFELLKTRMQLGKSWRMDSSPGAVRPISMVRYRPLAQVLELYKGLGVTFFRNVLLLSTMFSALDCSTRMAPGLAGAPMVGPFFLGSVCNTVGWFVAWPFEVLKSKVQAGQFRRRSIPQMFAAVVQADGVKGLWRGYLLGGTRSFFVNGCSMVAYQCVLDLRRKRKDQRALGDADIKR